MSADRPSPSDHEDRPRERPARRLAAHLALGLLALAAGLGAGELLCRWAPVERPPLRFEGFGGRMGEHSVMREVVSSAVIPDPDLFWRLAPGTTLSPNPWMPGLVANRQGLRETAEVPLERPASELRILFLGDSCTFGWGLREQESLVAQVEAALRARLPDRPIQCINAGVPAYTAFQGWRYLVTEGLAFAPELVVVTFGNNESISWDDRSDLEHWAAWQATRPPAGLQWSALARLLFRALATAPGKAAGGPPRPRLLPAEFRDVLGRIAGASTHAGADVLYLSWPVRENLEPHRTADDRHPLQQVIAGLAAGPAPRGLATLDLVPLAHRLADRHPLPELYVDGIHGTALANREYARAVADRIAGWVTTTRPDLPPAGAPAER